ncbi:CTLH [Musa troglodytarum]|uniref:CTLH n=1 Tax=Musa troglodytarum TaxID=320322 RepID=A0A9E7HK13_9LILI|nr:CTLH [Musa troglodytarum]
MPLSAPREGLFEIWGFGAGIESQSPIAAWGRPILSVWSSESVLDWGFSRPTSAISVLEEESGISLYSSMVDLFRKQVLDGNWDESLITLHKIGLDDENILKSVSFLILEQKFFEILEKNRIMEALETLRSEITPLSINKKRVHEFSSCIVSPSQRILLGFANVGTETLKPRMKLLEELQKMLPPSIMVPERRLEHLVEQALGVQREACYFHNSHESCLSLYTDHQCGKDQLPSHTTQVLQEHHDEVWFLQFSNEGKYLASSSNDKSAIIWEVCEDGELTLKHKLIGHKKSVLMVAWSPDDGQLLTCGMEEAVRRWDVHSVNASTSEKTGLGLISCGWLLHGKQLFLEWIRLFALGFRWQRTGLLERAENK